MKSRPQYLKPLLLLVALSLVCSVMAASPPVSKPQPQHRSLYLFGEPNEPAPEIQVAARTSSTLRFELPPSPSRATLGGWADRFEPPLVGGSSVVVVPLHALSSTDRVPLTVTLADGTVLPFTLVPAQDTVDVQVDVFPHAESAKALRRALDEAQEENKKLRSEVHRYQQEQLSTEHALATLFVREEHVALRSQERQKWSLRGEEFDLKVHLIETFNTTHHAAFVFTLTNTSRTQSWDLQEVRLTSERTGEEKAIAVRTLLDSIAPGKTGTFVVVTAMLPEGTEEKFLLEVFKRGGLRDIGLMGVTLAESPPSP